MQQAVPILEELLSMHPANAVQVMGFVLEAMRQKSGIPPELVATFSKLFSGNEIELVCNCETCVAKRN